MRARSKEDNTEKPDLNKKRLSTRTIGRKNEKQWFYCKRCNCILTTRAKSKRGHRKELLGNIWREKSAPVRPQEKKNQKEKIRSERCASRRENFTNAIHGCMVTKVLRNKKTCTKGQRNKYRLGNVKPHKICTWHKPNIENNTNLARLVNWQTPK